LPPITFYVKTCKTILKEKKELYIIIGDDMKNICIYLIILILIGLAIMIAFSNKGEKADKRLEVLEHIDKKISFFQKSSIDRYVNYHLKHQNIPLKEVIIHVNIGLDQDYYQNTKPASNKYTNQVLVNKYHYLEKNYIPKDLVEINEGYSKPGMYLVREARDAYTKMAQEMKQEDLTIRAISSYRSYEYQERLYTKYLEQDGRENADRYSARPGYSEHQTGLVIDVDNETLPYEQFEKTKEFCWIKDHAHKYGFIIRYPKNKERITGYTYEAWHLRYVGKEIATNIKKHNITFDEYCAMNNSPM